MGRCMVKVNRVKEHIRQGQKSYGFMLTFPSATIIEIFGHLGFDHVMIDSEHGNFTPESVEEMVRAADNVGVTSLVRAPDQEASTIMRILDRGAMGIMAPHVNTRAEAERVVQAVKYYPLGKRGLGAHRASTFDITMTRAEYVEWANRETLIAIQLEEVEALNNLDDILKVEHIDLYTFGPNDLSQSLGVPGQATHPTVVEAMNRASAKIRAAGKHVAGDWMRSANVPGLLISAASAFLKEAKASK